jgi:hypothetical protein
LICYPYEAFEQKSIWLEIPPPRCGGALDLTSATSLACEIPKTGQRLRDFQITPLWHRMVETTFHALSASDQGMAYPLKPILRGRLDPGLAQEPREEKTLDETFALQGPTPGGLDGETPSLDLTPQH